MRTSAVSRPARRAAVVAAAALTVGAVLPVLSAGTARAACGDTPPAAASPAPRHTTDPVAGFVPPLPETAAPGGPAVEIALEQANFTGAPYERLAPQLALFASESSAEPGRLVNLQPEDVTVEVMRQGAWQQLPVHQGCDPTLTVDTSSVAEPVPDGQAHRYLFRLALTASLPAELTRIDVLGGPGVAGGTASFTLTVERSAADAAPAAAAAPAGAVPVGTAPVASVTGAAAAPSLAGFGVVTGSAVLAAGSGALLVRRSRRR
ncbi:hypothetical protein [Kitasatospora sp. NE20-6]|uniref:hypothetical protein n=1 Tax=Kitasatospora sp. NE20-6 TaxID=2859066 RepID=UPI0038B32117